MGFGWFGWFGWLGEGFRLGWLGWLGCLGVARARLRVRGGVSHAVRTLWSQVALSSRVWWRGSAAAMARMCA